MGRQGDNSEVRTRSGRKAEEEQPKAGVRGGDAGLETRSRKKETEERAPQPTEVRGLWGRHTPGTVSG